MYRFAARRGHASEDNGETIEADGEVFAGRSNLLLLRCKTMDGDPDQIPIAILR